MANNYLQLSEQLELPEGSKDRATALINKLEADREEGCEENFDVNYEVEEKGVWFVSEEGCNLDHCIIIVQALMKEFDIKEPFIISWSYSCSKMRLSEFGGGAAIITKDDYEIIDARNLAEQIGEALKKKKKVIATYFDAYELKRKGKS